MSPLSSNTLFHFTDTRENLLNILTNEFRPHYCLEDFSTLGNLQPGTAGELVAFPLVCFCDIPLSQVKDHMETYGRYALGLKKEWGIRNGITPVLYAHANAILVQGLPEILGRVASPDEMKDPIMKHIGQLLCHMKPYKGPFWRRGKQVDDVCFYNEREWRFVPPNIMELPFLLADGFKNEAKRSDANRAVEDLRISFEPADIRYVIVDSEGEILQMIRDLEHIKSRKYSRDDVRVLSSRVIAAANILEDF